MISVAGVPMIELIYKVTPPEIHLDGMSPRVENRGPGSVALVIENATAAECAIIEQKVRDALPATVRFWVEVMPASANAIVGYAHDILLRLLTGEDRTVGEFTIDIFAPDPKTLIAVIVTGVADKRNLAVLEAALREEFPKQPIEVHGERPAVEIQRDVDRLGDAAKGILDGG